MGEYKAPELEDIGSIAEFTAAFGDQVAFDTGFAADGVTPLVIIPALEGSKDGILVPS